MRTLFMYEIARSGRTTAVLCPIMAHMVLGPKSDKKLLLCDCPNARRVALQKLRMTVCTREFECPPRILLGYAPGTDQK
jgi:hypothetical protein